MPLLQLVVLAIVQGITEYLPISSSAHLILVPLLVDGWADQGRGIDVAAHVGTLGAVLMYFRAETAGLFRGSFDLVRLRQTPDQRLVLLLAAGTIPLVLLGLVLSVTGIADHLRSPLVIGSASIFFGIILWLADRRSAPLDEAPSTWKAVATIGAAQALAIIPGTSRSGITMTAARWLGYTREQSARFSMLLAIPAIIASGTFEGLKMMKDGAGTTLLPMLTVIVLSFFSAWAAIAIFMKLTRSMSFTPFVIYRIALGLILIGLFA